MSEIIVSWHFLGLDKLGLQLSRFLNSKAEIDSNSSRTTSQFLIWSTTMLIIISYTNQKFWIMQKIWQNWTWIRIHSVAFDFECMHISWSWSIWQVARVGMSKVIINRGAGVELSQPSFNIILIIHWITRCQKFP